MTKILFRFAAVSFLLIGLSGCFGANVDTKPSMNTDTTKETPTTDTATDTTTTTPTATPPTTTPTTQPSYDDGQLYLKAIGAHDTKLCTKIADANLKTRCEKDAKPTSATPSK